MSTNNRKSKGRRATDTAAKDKPLRLEGAQPEGLPAGVAQPDRAQAAGAPAKAGDTKANDVKTTDTKADDAKAGGANTAKSNDTKANDTKASAAQAATPAAAKDHAQPRPAAHERPAPSTTVVKKGGFGAGLLGGIVALGLGGAALHYNLPERMGVPLMQGDKVDLDALRDDARKAGGDAGRQAGEKAGQEAGQKAGQEAGEQAARTALEQAATQMPDDGSDNAPSAEGGKPLADEVAALRDQLAALKAAQDQSAQNQDTAPTKAQAAATRQDAAPTEQQPAPGAIATPEILGQIKDMRSRLADLDQRNQQLAQENKALADRLAQLGDRDLPDMQAIADEARAKIDNAVTEAKGRLDAMRDQADEIKGEILNAAQRARQSEALTLLREGLATGDTAEAVARLQDAGVQPPAEVANAPSLATLREAYPAAADAALIAGRRAETAQGGTLDRVAGFLQSQTGARSVTPREGNDTDAILSRATDGLDRGDVAGALDQLGSLSDAAKAPMQEWIDQAQAYVAAQDAVEQLTAQGE